MIQLANMIYRGVPELFPRLRLSFLEAGCTWVPYTARLTLEESELWVRPMLCESLRKKFCRCPSSPSSAIRIS